MIDVFHDMLISIRLPAGFAKNVQIVKMINLNKLIDSSVSCWLKNFRAELLSLSFVQFWMLENSFLVDSSTLSQQYSFEQTTSLRVSTKSATELKTWSNSKCVSIFYAFILTCFVECRDCHIIERIEKSKKENLSAELIYSHRWYPTFDEWVLCLSVLFGPIRDANIHAFCGVNKT